MSQYNFYTRVLGPDAKGSALTLEELDNSLLFLSSSIGDLSSVSQSVVNISQSVVDLTSEVLILSQSISEIEIKPLSGSNYLFVEANGTPTQNALFLSASYVVAKNLTLTSTNRFSLLVAPGRYQFASDFILDTEYLDVVSLTGEKDVYLTGSSINVVANDVYVRGIDVSNNNFEIATDLNLLKVKNCKGGDLSFGGTADLPLSGSLPSSSILVNGTFIDCEGGDLSFGGNGIASGIFENCIGGEGSFGFDIIGGTFINCEGGDFSFGGAEGDLDSGYFENCTGGEGSFTVVGNILEDTIIKDCTGGLYSFSSFGTPIEGNLYGCRLTSGSFAPAVAGSGSLRLCINGTNQIVNLP
jgi:hypothetical protein